MVAAAAAVAAAAISAYGANQAAGTQADAISGAAGTQAQATLASVAEQRRQFDQIREDFGPYRDIGEAALGEYAALWGLGREGQIPIYAADVEDIPETISREVTETTAPAIRGGFTGTLSDIVGEVGQEGLRRLRSAGGLVPVGFGGEYENEGQPLFMVLAGAGGSGTTRTFTEDIPNPALEGPRVSRSIEEARERFKATPGYQFRMDEGIRALDRSAAARGELGSGGYGRDLQTFAQGLAAEEFHSYADRLAGLASTGQASAAGTATAGLATGQGIANTLMRGAANQGNLLAQAGTARASGYVGASNAVSGGLRDYMFFQSMQQGNQQGSYNYAPAASNQGGYSY